MPGPRRPGLTPYMTPVGRAAHSGIYRRTVAVTAAQGGKTETILDVMGARLAQRPTPILYVGPSREFNIDQFEPRLMGLLDEAASLAAKVARGKRMKKTRKIVAGVPVRLAHAGSSTALKSDPAGLAIIDEYDEMKHNVRGQGDVLGLVDARGDSHADFHTLVVSTCSRGIVETEIDPVSGLEFWKPGKKEEIESPIWRLWQEGTRHHWAWPCPHCDTYFVPRLKHLKWPPNSTPAQARKAAYLLCPADGCGGVIEEDQKARMNAKGVMVAPGQTIDDAFHERNVPENGTWSSWASGLCSPFKTFGERAERLLTALISGEEDKIQTATNTAFGELYAPGGGGDLPEWQELLKHRLPYTARTVPREVIRLAMGVDVQKRGLYFVVRGFGSRGTSFLIDRGFLRGLTDDDRVWSELSTLMLSPIGGMHIEKVFIDSGFRPDKPEAGSEHRVYEFCRRYSFMCSPTKGRDSLGLQPYMVKRIEVKPDGSKRPYSLELIHVNTDFFKGLVQSRIKIPLGQPGAFYLCEDADEEYARQVLSEARVVEPGGRPKWQKLRRDNHFFDCEALVAVAGYALNVQAIPEGIVREFAIEELAAEASDEIEDDAAAVPAPAVARHEISDALRARFQNLGRRGL